MATKADGIFRQTVFRFPLYSWYVSHRIWSSKIWQWFYSPYLSRGDMKFKQYNCSIYSIFKSNSLKKNESQILLLIQHHWNSPILHICNWYQNVTNHVHSLKIVIWTLLLASLKSEFSIFIVSNMKKETQYETKEMPEITFNCRTFSSHQYDNIQFPFYAVIQMSEYKCELWQCFFARSELKENIKWTWMHMCLNGILIDRSPYLWFSTEKNILIF